jgi:mannose-6-phosphate isomerase-like protein (cupin superfamily)
MPEASRPEPVGNYEVLQDHEMRDASIRVIRMDSAADAVEPHVHHRSQQVYFALEGRAVITVDGVEQTIEPYAAVTIPRGAVHTARPADGVAVVMNISLPPLTAEDQIPMPPGADMRMPGELSDIDD